jgi:hypothetical protein
MDDFLYLPQLVRAHPDLFKLELTFLSEHQTESSLIQPLLQASSHSVTGSSYSLQIPSIFVLILAMQFQIWLTSGHGEYQVLSEWYRKGKLRVQLKAGASYIDYVTKEELTTILDWLSLVESTRKSCS